VRLARELEPEVMDTPEEARDYDAMDHAEVNARFCDDLLAASATRSRSMLDVGTGTALIPIEICRRDPKISVCAIDLAENMLALARRNVERAGFVDRIRLERRDAKATGWPDGAFDAVVSNSIVHHIPQPADALREMWRLVATGGVIFVRDLARPDSEAGLRELVAKHAPVAAEGDPAATARSLRQRKLFGASLRAALTVDEVADLVVLLGTPRNAVRRTSDRHWTLRATRPRARPT
jgi:ubiquinone/menaquinone biosynthesis C-methylase UbiE